VYLWEKDRKNGVASSMLDYSGSEVLPAGFPTLKKEIEAMCRQMPDAWEGQWRGLAGVF